MKKRTGSYVNIRIIANEDLAHKLNVVNSTTLIIISFVLKLITKLEPRTILFYSVASSLVKKTLREWQTFNSRDQHEMEVFIVTQIGFENTKVLLFLT